MSGEQMTWAQALAQLEEAPPMDQEIRSRYCEMIRSEVVRLTEELRFARGERRRTPAAIEAPASNPKRVLREALVWFRGTSLSIRVQPEDRPWAEELHTALGDKPGTITLRLEGASTEEILAAFEGIQKGMAARFRVGIANVREPGDIQIPGCVARSIGGFDGVSPIICFGVAAREAIEIVSEPPANVPLAAHPSNARDLEPRPVLNAAGEKVGEESSACAHDNVTVVFNEKDGPVARCLACGSLIGVDASAPSPPSGYVEVDPIDRSFTALTVLTKKLTALAPPGASNVVVQKHDRVYVLATHASSAEKLALVKRVMWKGV